MTFFFFFRRAYLLGLFISLSFFVNAQSNLQLLGHYTYPNGVTASNLTGYADSLGREYALVGTSQGLSIVSIDTPSNPQQLFFVPGAIGQGGFWREVREYRGYAYVTTEQSSGLVIVNLNFLPDSIQYHTVNPVGMRTSHTVFIDEKGFAYINGTDRDQLILNLNANPYNPPVVGRFTNNYVHDCFVRNDTMWAACVNDGIMKVVDVRNKSTVDNATNTIATWTTPLNFSHNAWLSDDGKYIFTTDEKPNSTLTCYDVSDLSNVTETAKTQVDPGSNTIIHNTHFINDFCVTSYYTYGITIHDVARKSNLVEVGQYDTSPAYSGDGFHGAWGVWPYLPSGNVIASDIETGLWIFKPTYRRACYLEGTVKDSSCNTLLNNVTIEIIGTGVSTKTNFVGQYATGIADSGTYNIRFSKPGYQPKVLSNVVMKNGVLTSFDVMLLPISTTQLVVKTTTDGNSVPLPFQTVLIQNDADVDYSSFVTGANAEYSFCDFVQGSYSVYAGSWGRQTTLVNESVATLTDTVTIALAKDYYDDFIMDYGWTVYGNATLGKWKWGKPVETTYNGNVCNPGLDINSDFGNKCYVTGNNGGQAGDDDVDNGSTILESPVFDLSTYVDPYISYYRWFFNDGGQGTPPNDSLVVRLTNGTDSTTIDVARNSASQWVFRNIRVADFITPTSTMHIKFIAIDANPGHLVEAGVDVFQVVDSGVVNGLSPNSAASAITVFPNPAHDFITVEWSNQMSASAMLYDVSGRIMKSFVINEKVNRLSVSDLSNGVYILKLLSNGVVLREWKVVKMD